MILILTKLAFVFACCECRTSSSNQYDDLGLFLPGDEVQVRKAGDKIRVLIVHPAIPPLDLSEDGKSSLQRVISGILTLGESKFITKEITGVTRALYETIFVAHEKAKDIKVLVASIQSFTNVKEKSKNITDSCSVTLEQFNFDSKIVSLIKQLDNLNKTLADIEAKYKAKPFVAPTEDERDKAVQITQVETNALVLSLDSMQTPLVIRRNMLDSASNGLVGPYLLGDLDALECVPSGLQEHSEIVLLHRSSNQVVFYVQIAQLDNPMIYSKVLPVPFLLGNTSYVIEVDNDLLFEPTTGRVLDLHNCEPSGANSYICKKIKTRKHACLTEAWDEQTIIPKPCNFKKTKFSDDLYYVRVDEGTLVAQLSNKPVVVSYKDKAIRKNPVLVEHSADLKISVDGDTTLVDGIPGATFAVHYNDLSHDQLLKRIDPKTYYLRKLIPDSYSDYAYVALAIAVSLLFLPHLYSLIKCCLVCCGVLEKRRDVNRWYLPKGYEYSRRSPKYRRRRHNIEDHYDSDSTEPIRERLAMLPLQAIPPAQERRVLNNVLHDARNMSLGQFLRRYVEPRKELVEFYGLVHSRDVTQQENRRLR